LRRYGGVARTANPREEERMSLIGRWPRVLSIVGLVAMVIGCVDPLEGSGAVTP
jgi:hypothetical protein